MSKSLKKYSLLCGLALSCIIIVMSLIFYLVDPSSINKSKSYKLLFYLILLLFPIIFTLNKYNYFSDFKSHFTILFLSQAISIFFHMIFVFTIYKLIDADLFEEFVNINSNNLLELNLDIPLNNSFDSKDYRQEVIDSFNLKNQINSYIFSLLPCIVYSALISLLIKILKKP